MDVPCEVCLQFVTSIFNIQEVFSVFEKFAPILKTTIDAVSTPMVDSFFRKKVAFVSERKESYDDAWGRETQFVAACLCWSMYGATGAVSFQRNGIGTRQSDDDPDYGAPPTGGTTVL
jgi:hypothetical protein